MDKNENIVFAIGVLIGTGLTMLATNIRGYLKAVKAMDAEDYDAKETALMEMIGSCETKIFGHGEVDHE